MRYDCWKKPVNYAAINPEGVPWDAFHWRPSGDTLAEAAAKEHAATMEIQRDPFRRLPLSLPGGAKDWLTMGKGRCWVDKRAVKVAPRDAAAAGGLIRFGATPSEKRRAAAAKAVATRRARLGPVAPGALSPRAIPSEARHLAAVKAAATRRRNAAK